MSNYRDKTSASGSKMFLLELVGAILIFSVCASLCMLMLVKAHKMSREADQLRQAISYATDIAESFQAGAEGIFEGYPELRAEKELRTEDGMEILTITITDLKGSEIYLLKTEKLAGGSNE